ncbi:MAG TPA: response regulator [Bacteroidales bacterium]|nr:response regulator [Bacteroidales bacterium]HPT01304.1 response regulator [Bacteroidales bacterium]
METLASKPKVLIIDDEVQIRRLLRITLEANDYHVIESENGKNGVLLSAMEHPDVILLDLGLPDMDGLQLLERLREWSAVPVIILTVRDEEKVMIKALDSGADDYVTKPFNTGELLARIRVAIRHSLRIDESPVFTRGRLSVDLTNRIVKVNNEEVRLTALEYNLLSLMVKNAGKVLTHAYIIRELWGNAYADNAQTLRVHVAQLRRKIEANPSIPEMLITEPGVGYRLV